MLTRQNKQGSQHPLEVLQTIHAYCGMKRTYRNVNTRLELPIFSFLLSGDKWNNVVQECLLERDVTVLTKKHSVLTFSHKLYNLGEVKIESSQCDGAWRVPLTGLSWLPFWAHVQLPSVSPGTLFPHPSVVGGFNCQDFHH